MKMLLRLRPRVILSIGLYVVLISQSGFAENLAGLVTSPDGQPIAGALVSAIGTSTVPWTNARTVSSADGAFSFSGLSPGAYRMCVELPAGGYLNPCQWSLAPPLAKITPGASINGFRLKIDQGSILRVRVNDPHHLLGTGQGYEVLLGAHTPAGLFQPAALRATDAAGRDHEVTVPFDTIVKFSVRANRLQVTNEDGSAVGDGAVVPVQRNRGQGSQRPLVFNVTGGRP